MLLARITLPLLLVICAAPARAIDTGPAFADPVLQQRYETIVSQVRCLTCQNQTIKDSNALLASDLRREVRERLAAGASDAEIYEFLTARYGDFALYRPPLTARTAVLWAAPLALLTFGLAVLVRVVRRRAALARDGESEPAP